RHRRDLETIVASEGEPSPIRREDRPPRVRLQQRFLPPLPSDQPNTARIAESRDREIPLVPGDITDEAALFEQAVPRSRPFDRYPPGPARLARPGNSGCGLGSEVDHGALTVGPPSRESGDAGGRNLPEQAALDVEDGQGLLPGGQIGGKRHTVSVVGCEDVEVVAGWHRQSVGHASRAVGP